MMQQTSFNLIEIRDGAHHLFDAIKGYSISAGTGGKAEDHQEAMIDSSLAILLDLVDPHGNLEPSGLEDDLSDIYQSSLDGAISDKESTVLLNLREICREIRRLSFNRKAESILDFEPLVARFKKLLSFIDSPSNMDGLRIGTSPAGQPAIVNSQLLEGKLTADDQEVKSNGRKRATKEETQLKISAAILYKMSHPGASESEVAKEAGIPVSTLNDRNDWKEWLLRINQAAQNGTMNSVKLAYDARIDEHLAYQKDDSGNPFP